MRIRSGLAAATNALRNLAPLLIMCDAEDIGCLAEPKSVLADGLPAILVYDGMPGGLGLSVNCMKNKAFGSHAPQKPLKAALARRMPRLRWTSWRTRLRWQS